MTRRIPWWLPQLTGRERDALSAVLNSNYLNDGPVTRQFEARIAELLGARYAVGVTSGTSALTLSLMAADIGPGDEVLVPDVTFIATANAVRLAGAEPVLVDVDASSLTISVAAAELAITPRTRAILPVHVSGRAADMRAVLRLAQRRGLTVIEDAAEAFMSRHEGRALGTFGLTGCFSFSPNKTITTGQGGMIVTDDAAVHRRLRELKDQGRPVQGTGGDDVHASLGYNFKLTDLQSAVGLAQLDALEHRLDRMRSIYCVYRHELSSVDGLTLPGFAIDTGEVPQWTDAIIERRDELDRFLAERGVGCRRFWYPLHTQQPYLAAAARFPNSAAQMPRALWLPSAFTLSDDDIAYTCGLIREYFEGHPQNIPLPAAAAQT